jgi:PAS domain S-box-containing protein
MCKDVSCLTYIWFVGTIMSVAYARERSLPLSYDVDNGSADQESRGAAGLLSTLISERAEAPSTPCKPAWLTLAGNIAGLDFGRGRVEFVWPSTHDCRQGPAKRLFTIQDNCSRFPTAGYSSIKVNASFDRQSYNQLDGLQNVEFPRSRVKHPDEVVENSEIVLEAIVRGDALDSVFTQICCLSDAMNVRSHCSILMIDSVANRLQYGAGPKLPAEYKTIIDATPFAFLDNFWGVDTDKSEALAVADIVSDPEWCGFRQFALNHGLQVCWAFPIVTDDAVHGILAIHHEEFRAPDDGEIIVARRLTRLAALAIVRRRADDLTLRNAERHALAVQGANIGIWDWDIESGSVYCSPLLKSMLGLELEDDLDPDPTFNGLLHPEDQERIDEVLQRHLTDQMPYDAICRIRRTDGSYRWVRIKAQAAWNATGVPVRLVGCIYDISDQKQAEEQLRAACDAAETASRAKSQFLTNISHELYTPLNTILGMGEILKDAILTPMSVRTQQNTTIIDHSGRHLLGLIDGILEVARLEAEQVELNEEEVALATVLDEAIQSVRLSHGEPRHKLTLDLPSPLPVLSVDRRCLKQVLINVLGEAVKSTPQNGRIAVKVSRSGGELEIKIEDSRPRDTGTWAPNILHPLYCLEAVMSQRHQDNTQEMFISKILIERQGGRLRIENKEDIGKAVFISLPVECLLTSKVSQTNRPKAWRHVASLAI